MKVIENKKVLEPKDGERGSATLYSELMIHCINAGTKEGILISEMRAKLKVVELLEDSRDRDVIELEDADHEVVLEAVKTMKWAVIHRDIVEFAEAVEEATDKASENATDKSPEENTPKDGDT